MCLCVMCVCVYDYVCVCTCMHAHHAYTYRSQKRMLVILPSQFLPYSFEAGFLMKPGAVLAAIKLTCGYWGLESGSFSYTESICTHWKVLLPHETGCLLSQLF